MQALQMSTQLASFLVGTEAEDEDEMRGLSVEFSCEKCSSTSLCLMTRSRGLASSSGSGTGGPHAPAHILAHLPVTYGHLGLGAPKQACKSVPMAPFPGAATGSWPSCQLSLSPRTSLSYKMKRTWKLKQEKQLAGPECSWGSYGKTTQPEWPHYLYVSSLEETYMVSKRTSSHHKTKSHLFVARQSTTKLTETTARHGKYLTIAGWHHSYFSPSASQNVGFKETAYSISYQGGRRPI